MMMRNMYRITSKTILRSKLGSWSSSVSSVNVTYALFVTSYSRTYTYMLANCVNKSENLECKWC